MIEAAGPPTHVTLANRIDGAFVLDCGAYRCVFDHYQDAADAAFAAADYYHVPVVRVVLVWTRLIDGTILELPQSVFALTDLHDTNASLSERN